MGCLAYTISKALMPFRMRITPISRDFTHYSHRYR
jgi:hypothetical protein